MLKTRLKYVLDKIVREYMYLFICTVQYMHRSIHTANSLYEHANMTGYQTETTELGRVYIIGRESAQFSGLVQWYYITLGVVM